MNKDFQTECYEECKDYAEMAEAYAAKKMYRCPECGCEIFWDDHDPKKDKCKCICCEQLYAENQLEKLSIWDFLDNTYDIEYRIDASRQYKSVRIMVAGGGPNIFLDTKEKAVQLYWGWTETSYPLSYKACEVIDDYCEEQYRNY